MKSIKFFVAAAALVGMVACCNNAPKQYMGFIADATMNTVTVRALDTEATQLFSTEDADMSEANGMLIGSPIIVDYTGCLKEGTPATKVTTDPTYSEAVGKWTMTDPINPAAVMGVELMIDGAAQSINMASLPYSSWELQGEAGKVILKGQSIGNSETIDFTQTGIIAQNAEGAWTLTIEGTEVVLTKQVL